MPASSMSEIISTVAAAAAALLPAAGVGRGSHIRACEGWAGKNETCGRCRLSLIPILYRRCTSIPTTSHSITSASRVTMEPGPSGSVGMPPSLHLSDQARLAVLCSDIRPVHSTFFLKASSCSGWRVRRQCRCAASGMARMATTTRRSLLSARSITAHRTKIYKNCHMHVHTRVDVFVRARHFRTCGSIIYTSCMRSTHMLVLFVQICLFGSACCTVAWVCCIFAVLPSIPFTQFSLERCMPVAMA